MLTTKSTREPQRYERLDCQTPGDKYGGRGVNKSAKKTINVNRLLSAKLSSEADVGHTCYVIFFELYCKLQILYES